MEFRVLGPLEIRDDSGGVIPVRAPKERALLLSLLLHANEVVSSERLVDELWGEQRPESAAKVIQTYVSHLRRLLQPDKARGGHGLIVTRSPGYLLRLDPGQMDRDRFESLVAEARSRDDAEQSLALLREALGLWRGPPLQEFAFEEFARTEIARLEELRLSVVGERIELELRLGRNGDLVAELEALVAAHPYREQLRGQLMQALYGSGRQAEALQVYQETRRLLVEELGIEPSLPLRELEQAILRQDAVLEREGPASRQASAAAETEPQRTVPQAPPSDVRKTVTIVFSDLVGSSHLSPERDPEALRNLLSRYFDGMRAVLERHGGIVEKYIGDAIMAVFGIPVLHEDDALRAVRAAIEMREALAALNEELERVWGVQLAARIGVNTGEVIAGDHSQGYRFVTGEAVTVAKRLEEAAGTGEILIGEATHRLVRDAVRVEPGGRREIKHGESIDALRLVEVFEHTVGHARRFDSPFVGTRAAARGAANRVRECGQRSSLPPAHGARRGRRRQVAAGAGVRRSARRRGDSAQGPLPALRRGHQLLAAGRGRQGCGARGRPGPRRGGGGDRGASRGRGEGGADRRARRRGGGTRRPGRRNERGDLLGGPEALRGARPQRPAGGRVRRRPLGAADVPRSGRARRGLLA